MARSSSMVQEGLFECRLLLTSLTGPVLFALQFFTELAEILSVN